MTLGTSTMLQEGSQAMHMSGKMADAAARQGPEAPSTAPEVCHTRPATRHHDYVARCTHATTACPC